MSQEQNLQSFVAAAENAFQEVSPNDELAKLKAQKEVYEAKANLAEWRRENWKEGMPLSLKDYNEQWNTATQAATALEPRMAALLSGPTQTWYCVHGTIKDWRQAGGMREALFLHADLNCASGVPNEAIVHFPDSHDVALCLYFPAQNQARDFVASVHSLASYRKLSVIDALPRDPIAQVPQGVMPIKHNMYSLAEDSPPLSISSSNTTSVMDRRRAELLNWHLVDAGKSPNILHIVPDALFPMNSKKYHPVSVLLIGGAGFNSLFDGTFAGSKHPQVLITIHNEQPDITCCGINRRPLELKVELLSVNADYEVVWPQTLISNTHTKAPQKTEEVREYYTTVYVECSHVTVFREALSWRYEATMLACRLAKEGRTVSWNNQPRGSGWWLQTPLSEELKNVAAAVAEKKKVKKKGRDEEDY